MSFLWLLQQVITNLVASNNPVYALAVLEARSLQSFSLSYMEGVGGPGGSVPRLFQLLEAAGYPGLAAS